MSDTDLPQTDQAPPPSSPPSLPDAAPSAPEPVASEPPAALQAAPDGPPPVPVPEAGADVPPATTSPVPEAVPAAAAPIEPTPAGSPPADVPDLPVATAAPPPLVESTPALGTEKLSDVVDSQAAAVATLGEDSGLRDPVPEPAPETTIEKIEGVFEHPHEALLSLRTKLAAYGEECVETIKHEIAWLHQLFDKL